MEDARLMVRERDQLLMEAARWGKKEDVAALLAAGADPKARGSEALRWAVKYGHEEVVDLLIPVSEPKAFKSEAFRWAARSGREDIVKRLLPVSDPMEKDINGLTSADLARMSGFSGLGAWIESCALALREKECLRDMSRAEWEPRGEDGSQRAAARAAKRV